MCGIAGIFAYHEVAPAVDREELLAIRDYMTARGPDGCGVWFADDGRIGLAHRRLSIIDLSKRGAQPMHSADGVHVVTFNGEIYNYRALRRQLETQGCVFHSDSDTEVLLHLYAAKGEAMLNDLRGMFAFAIWDARKRALFMARDPYGIKPLYYADDGWTLHFASQVKALLASNRVSRTPEPAGLAGFYIFGSVPEPFTLYQEIRAVPAGCYLWVDGIGPREPVAYASIAGIWAQAEQATASNPAELQSGVRDAVLDSVRQHMIADVPVGAFLSAGIDSGALLGLMNDACDGHPTREETGAIGQGSSIQTITLGFEEFRGSQADEAPLARQVAQHYGARHSVHMVTEGDFHADLPNILAAMDQPSIDGINTWLVSKAASEAGFKVAVSGVGGDELFGGYPSFRDIPRWVRAMWLPTRLPGLGALAEQVQAMFAPLFPNLHPKMVGMLRYAGRYPGSYLLRRGLFLPRELPQLLGAELAREGLRRLNVLNHIQKQLGPESPKQPYGIVTSLEATLYMRNQLLRDTDWASMAHSLEVRTPLVDINLLKAVAPLIAASRPRNFKHLLASAPNKPLPDVVSNRAKSGFTTPIANWQQHSDRTLSWHSVELLARSNCPWARRWSFAVANLMT